MKKSFYNVISRKLHCRCLALLVILSIGLSFVMPPMRSQAAITGTDSTSVTSFVVYYTNVDAGVQFDTGVKRDGSTSLKMYNRTQKQDGNVFMVYQKLAVEKGKTYDCGISVKGENVNSASLVFANWDLNSKLKPFGPTFDWIDLKFTYTHLRDSGSYDFQIMLSDKATALWVDNLYMYELDEDGNRIGENLIKNNSFEKRGTGAKMAVGNGGDGGNNILLGRAPKDIKIDGQPDEWKNAKAYPFEAARMQYLGGQANDIEAQVQYFFDENYLYFAITADDPRHFSQAISNYWSVDSVQYAVSATDEAYGKELGLVYVEEDKSSHSYGYDGIVFKGSRTGEKTFYEVAVPWSVRDWNGVPEKILFGAIMNNSNGHGRVGTVEYTTGISSLKTNSGFVQLIPFDENTGFLAVLEANGDVKAGEVCEFSVLIINGNKEAREINISIPEFKYNETFNVSGGGSYTAVFEETIEKSGTLALTLDVSCNGDSKEIVKEITVLPNNDVLKKYCEDLDEKCKNLEKKIYECSKEGHYVDYELTNLNIIKLYKSYLEDDLAHNIYNYAANTYNGLINIYNESIKNLEAYISGEKKSYYVPKLKSTDYSMEDGGFRAEVITENGKVEKQPVFYLGYNKRGGALSAEDFKDIGLSVATVEFDPKYGIAADKKILCFNVSNEDFFEITEEDTGGGKYALKLSVPEDESATLTQQVNIDYLCEYEVRFKAKGENVSSAYLSFGDKAMQELSGTFDWTEYTLETKASGMEMSRQLKLVCNSAQKLCIDDISIIKKGGGYDCVNNGNFETGYGNRSERGYVFIESYADRINYMLRELVELGIPINISTPWYISDEIRAVLSKKDPAFDEYGKLSRAHNNHPLFLEYVTYFITELMSRIEYPDKIFSACLYNEPHHNTNYEWYRPYWSEFLKEVYGGDLSKLNESHNAAYESFDVVPFPTNTNDTTNLFNDYMRFNNKMLADFMVELVGAFKSVAPDINCNVKIMEYVFKADKRLNYGNDYELWSDLFEINGCDSYSYKDLSSYPIASRLQWYDFMTSNKNVPIFDSELHMIPDGVKNVYNEDIKNYSLADRWQCAVHKLGATQIWLMDRGVDTYRMQHIFDATNLTLMPELFAAFSKQQYDLLRLANEITALQTREAEAAILFSHTAIQKNVKYTGDLHSVYANLLNSGEKVFVMNETRPELLLQNGIKVLFLPGATHVSATTVEAIKKFIEQGGRVVMTENDLKYDEHDNPQNKEMLDYIYKNADIIKRSDNESEAAMLERMVKYGVEKCELSEIKLVYAENGEEIKNSEYEYTSYNGKTLLNICNYDWNTRKEINVYYKGQKITDFKELISGEKYGENILLEPYIPILLEF